MCTSLKETCSYDVIPSVWGMKVLISHLIFLLQQLVIHQSCGCLEEVGLGRKYFVYIFLVLFFGTVKVMVV